jgi:hypothetical protein
MPISPNDRSRENSSGRIHYSTGRARPRGLSVRWSASQGAAPCQSGPRPVGERTAMIAGCSSTEAVNNLVKRVKRSRSGCGASTESAPWSTPEDPTGHSSARSSHHEIRRATNPRWGLAWNMIPPRCPRIWKAGARITCSSGHDLQIEWKRRLPVAHPTSSRRAPQDRRVTWTRTSAAPGPPSRCPGVSTAPSCRRYVETDPLSTGTRLPRGGQFQLPLTRARHVSVHGRAIRPRPRGARRAPRPQRAAGREACATNIEGPLAIGFTKVRHSNQA